MPKVPEIPILRKIVKLIPRNVCYLREDDFVVICNYDMFDPYGYWDDYDTYTEEEPPCQSCLIRPKRQAMIRDSGGAGILYTAWKGVLVKEESV